MARRPTITATTGTMWRRRIPLTRDGEPVPVTGGALFQVRPEVDSSTITLEASTDNGGITVTDGVLTIEVEVTAAPGSYAFGLALEDGGRLSEPILEGTFVVRRGLPRR